MEFLRAFGFLVILYCIVFRRDLLKIEWLTLAKFLVFMALVTAIRMSALASLDFIPLDYYLAKSMLRSIPLVPWEDAAFVIPIYFLKDEFKIKKIVWVPYAIVMALVFASGHLYQGIQGGVFAIIYLYISYRYGKKYGWGTVMVGHILYDFIVVMTMIIAKLVLI